VRRFQILQRVVRSGDNSINAPNARQVNVMSIAHLFYRTLAHVIYIKVEIGCMFPVREFVPSVNLIVVISDRIAVIRELRALSRNALKLCTLS
jgi:hypothetical protein